MTVSYCVTLFNKERYIAAVLGSILAEQASTGGEIIVYDDASTDGSRAIVERIAAETPVTLIAAERNRGVFAATEALIGAARCDYLRLVDGDDRLVAGSTRRLVAALDALQADLVHGRIETSLATSDVASTPKITERAFRKLLKSMDYNLSASLLRTASARRLLPLARGITVSQDLAIALGLARSGTIGEIDAVTALAPEETDNRLSRRLAAMFRAFCLITAPELGLRASRSDAAYAVRRNARRCLRYFAREAPGRLSLKDRITLAALACATPMRSVAASQRALEEIARIYERDLDRVLR